MTSKFRLYELTALFNVYVSDDASKGIINNCFENLDTSQFNIVSIVDKGRFEIQHKKLTTKINLMCCTFEADPSVIATVRKNTKEKVEIIRSLLILSKSKEKAGGFLDYKRPIDMKKYIFESLRIMPNELTGFSKRVQKALSQNIKRARILGLVGRFNK